MREGGREGEKEMDKETGHEDNKIIDNFLLQNSVILRTKLPVTASLHIKEGQ